MRAEGIRGLQQLVESAPKGPAPLPAWFERLTHLGIVSDDPRIVRRQRFTNMFALASAANIATHVAFYGVYNPRGLAPLLVANSLFLAAMLAVPLLHRAGANLAAHAVSGISLVAILLSVVALGREGQIYVYFALTGIIIFLFGVENPRAYVPWFVFALLGLALCLPFTPDHGFLAADDPFLRRIASTHAVANVVVVNILIIYFALSTLFRTESALEAQYARTAALTSSLLPVSVIERLTAAPERRIADRIDGLSVLFADLAGFTAAARNLPPEQVIDYLDGMVRAFDAVCAECGAEKIKTIGDCYMAVGGLAGDRRGGAVAIGRLALTMLAAQRAQPLLGGAPLELRIGLHYGVATAGIIGDTRFAYDVWGDAVNIAARMESHGVAGRIHVSDAYREAAEGAFDFEPRGEIEVRSVGRVRTFFLDGLPPGA